MLATSSFLTSDFSHINSTSFWPVGDDELIPEVSSWCTASALVHAPCLVLLGRSVSKIRTIYYTYARSHEGILTKTVKADKG